MNCTARFVDLTGVLRRLQRFFMLVTALAFATVANAESQLEGAGGPQRVDSSGKLRMLSQRVVATACYVHAGIETEATTAMLTESAQEFMAITNALEFGDPGLGIYGAETDPKTLATIERLEGIWEPIAAIVNEVVAGSATQEQITQLALQSEPLLEMAQRLVATVTAEHSLGASLIMRDALAIDIAGRQRMLSQRMSKDVCLLATGIDAEHARDDLAKTADIFDASLAALIGGMPSAGIEAPTSALVIADLDRAAADWAVVQTKIADALSGQPIDDERLAVMFQLANTLTADMNRVVVDYTEATTRSQ